MTKNNDQATKDKLNLITDPIAKMRLAFKKGLKDFTRQVLTEIISEYSLRFFKPVYSEDIPEDVFFPLTDDISEGNDKENKVLVFFFHSRNRNLVLALVLDELIDLLDWTNGATVEKVIKPTLQSLIKRNTPGTRDISFRVSSAAIEVCRKFLPAEKDALAKNVEIWVLKHCLRDAESIPSARSVCGSPISEEKGSGLFTLDGLDPVIDRLLELGMTQEEVCEEVLMCARLADKRYVVGLVLPYVGAKCFNANHPELCKFLIEECIPHRFKYFLQEPNSARFWIGNKLLIHRIIGNEDDAIKRFFIKQIIQLISEGRLTFAWQVSLALGNDAWGWIETSESYRIRETKDKFLELVPEAFHQACQSTNYGVAAALVLQFGKDVCQRSSTAIEKEVRSEFGEEYGSINAQYPEAEDEWDNRDADDDEYFTSGNGKGWKDKMDDWWSRLDIAIITATDQHEEQLVSVSGLAVELGQPICFSDPLTYLHLADWQN